MHISEKLYRQNLISGLTNEQSVTFYEVTRKWHAASGISHETALQWVASIEKKQSTIMDHKELVFFALILCTSI
jgi:DNA-binding PucR family transcriptional regulator